MKRYKGKGNSHPQFMEWIWLFVALLSLIAGVHAFIHHFARKGLIFLIMVVMSLAMFSLRIYFRKNKNNKDL